MLGNSAEDFGQAFTGLIQIVFSLMFPFVFITACGVSGLLFYGFQIPQFALLWGIAGQAIGYATKNVGAAVALAAFALASLPLAWVKFREMELKFSGVIGAWVVAAITTGFTFWLASVWPADWSFFQMVSFAFLLFMSWAAICEALLGTIKLVFHFRPRPGRGVVERQKAFGDARLAGEAEAIALLNPKK
jgi:hypothetical protein